MLLSRLYRLYNPAVKMEIEVGQIQTFARKKFIPEWK